LSNLLTSIFLFYLDSISPASAEKFRGTPENDHLTGTPDNDRTSRSGGNDTLTGLAGSE
jgi:hypothetical protein